MKTRLLIVLLLQISASVGIFSKKKKPEAETPSPLKQYITEATKNNSASQAARAPGAIWSSNAIYTNLGLDLRASRVDDLVTIVVIEKASAVATGDVKTQRTSTVQSAITAAERHNQSHRPIGKSGEGQHRYTIARHGRNQPRNHLDGHCERARGQRAAQRLPGSGGNQARASECRKPGDHDSPGVVRPVDLDTTNSIPSPTASRRWNCW